MCGVRDSCVCICLQLGCCRLKTSLISIPSSNVSPSFSYLNISSVLLLSPCKSPPLLRYHSVTERHSPPILWCHYYVVSKQHAGDYNVNMVDGVTEWRRRRLKTLCLPQMNITSSIYIGTLVCAAPSKTSLVALSWN